MFISIFQQRPAARFSHCFPGSVHFHGIILPSVAEPMLENPVKKALRGAAFFGLSCKVKKVPTVEQWCEVHLVFENGYGKCENIMPADCHAGEPHQDLDKLLSGVRARRRKGLDEGGTSIGNESLHKPTGPLCSGIFFPAWGILFLS